MKKHWLELGGVFMGYACAAALLTYPLLFQLSSGVVSHSQDAWIMVWGNWWIPHALSTGQNVFTTQFMFYPEGVSLASHSFSFTHTAISATLQLFTDPIAAYNLGTFLIFPVAGLSAYVLARTLTASRLAAWLAGLIYAFAPYHLTQALGHPHLSYVQFIPLAVWGVLKAIEHPQRRWRYVIVAITCLTLTAYAGPHLLVVALTWLAIFMPFEFIARRQPVTRSAMLVLAASVAGTLLLSLPLLLPAASDILAGQKSADLQTGDFEGEQTDLLAYAVPTRYHPIVGAALTDLYRNLGKNNQWMPYLGYAALALGVVGVVAQKRRALGWLVSLLGCVLLALGTQLRVNGVDTGVPLPFALVQNVFPFSFMRSPDRFNIMVSLPLAVLAAYGVAALERRWPRGRVALALLATAVIGLEYLSVPYPMLALPPESPFVAQLAQSPDDFAVLDLPMGRNAAKEYLYWQTRHHKPLVEGHVSRTPASAYDFIEANDLLRALRDPNQPVSADQRSAALAQLADRGVRYILVHVQRSNPDQVGQYRAILGSDPIYADEIVQVYATQP